MEAQEMGQAEPEESCEEGWGARGEGREMEVGRTKGSTRRRASAKNQKDRSCPRSRMDGEEEERRWGGESRGRAARLVREMSCWRMMVASTRESLDGRRKRKMSRLEASKIWRIEGGDAGAGLKRGGLGTGGERAPQPRGARELRGSELGRDR